MSVPPDKSGGQPPPDTTPEPTGTLSTTSAWAEGGVNGQEVRMRSFAEILASETSQRNILEIHLTRAEDKAKNLNFDDLGELIFDVLNINPTDCSGFNYSTGRYDTREVKFKPDIDLSPYIKVNLEFKGHLVSTKKQSANVTRVTFRNVPFNVPDEEIIQLCKCYGTPLHNKVNYEKLFNARNKGMMGGTRWVEMEFKSGYIMNNFYWMEGPLPGDTGCRITVLHTGQDQQCSHCLKTGREGCRAQGNGKACKEMKTPRTKMGDYVADLKRLMGYESLKSQYLQQFPSLQAGDGSNTVERMMDDVDVEEALLPSNPIERRDAQIADLQKDAAEIPALKESLVKMKAELQAAKKTSILSKRKLNFARKVTEERLKECLPIPSFEDDHSKVLITLMSTLVDEENFELDPNTETFMSKEDFLKDVEESIEKGGDEKLVKDRLDNVRNKLLERFKDSVASGRDRRLSISSISSQDSTKRKASQDLACEKDAVRSKPSFIPIST